MSIGFFVYDKSLCKFAEIQPRYKIGGKLSAQKEKYYIQNICVHNIVLLNTLYVAQHMFFLKRNLQHQQVSYTYMDGYKGKCLLHQ